MEQTSEKSTKKYFLSWILLKFFFLYIAMTEGGAISSCSTWIDLRFCQFIRNYIPKQINKCGIGGGISTKKTQLQIKSVCQSP